MKTIVRQAGNIGPFDVIDILSDRLRCDGIDYQFAILGEYTISDDPNDAPVIDPPPAPVPEQVTNAQAREALIRSGITIASVDAAIQAIPDATEREIAHTQWEYRQTIRRGSELVVSLGHDLGLNAEQIDDLFRFAATL